MASHEEDLQQFGKKNIRNKKTILNLSWKYKEQIVGLESVGQHLAPPNWSLFLQTTLIAQDPWMS
jgi:predicted sulfurtransferase